MLKLLEASWVTWGDPDSKHTNRQTEPHIDSLNLLRTNTEKLIYITLDEHLPSIVQALGTPHKWDSRERQVLTDESPQWDWSLADEGCHLEGFREELTFGKSELLVVRRRDITKDIQNVGCWRLGNLTGTKSRKFQTRSLGFISNSFHDPGELCLPLPSSTKAILFWFAWFVF